MTEKSTSAAADATSHALAAELHRIRKTAAILKARETEIRALILESHDGDKVIGINGEVLIDILRFPDAPRFDSASFKHDHPELYARYSPLTKIQPRLRFPKEAAE